MTSSGTTTLNTTNTYTGATTVGGGVLALNKAGTAPDPNNGYLTTGGTLTGTPGLTINTGGTLQLNASNAISSGPATGGSGNGGTGVTLGGGMLQLAAGVTQGQGGIVVNGVDNGTMLTVPGLGALVLTANSAVSFAGTAGTLVFNSLTANGFTLAVGGSHFALAMGNSTDGSTDRLIFENDASAPTTAFLASFVFTNYGNSPATDIDLGNGFYEIIPLNPVPEPSTWLSGLMGLGLLGLLRRRKSRAA